MHRWAAEPKPAEISEWAVSSRSASGSTTAWFLASERLHSLAMRRRGLVDVSSNRGRADERHRSDVRMGKERVDRHFVAVHHVEHPVRQTSAAEQLGQQE